jgi:hypothetical protein
VANPRKRVPENVVGDFFVDSTCADAARKKQGKSLGQERTLLLPLCSYQQVSSTA